MDFDKIYFLGIGGIGMSALARFFLHEGKKVAGYDRTPSDLTAALSNEGAEITYEDRVETIPACYRDAQTTLVVYTPAIPADCAQKNFFLQQGFTLTKRSQMLGVMARGKYLMAVSGTHGKTTTSTLAAWLNREAGGGGSAFLGGISKNFGSNLVLGSGNRLVVEADEFDRSFLQLYPDVAVVTAADADHLDIYGTHAAVKEAFAQFIDQIRPGGALILKTGVEVAVRNTQIRVWRYSYDTPCDFYARQIRVGEDGCYTFDLVCPDRVIADCRLGVPGWVNVENSVAAVAMLWVAGFDEAKLREALASFKGVRRRFDFHVNTPQRIYMDDYAHHPNELAAAITSVKQMFPGRRLTVIFQPHLYTRTRDFYREFAASLSLADEVMLLPIYPAREEPIAGVNSEMLLPLITVPAQLVQKEALLETLKKKQPSLLVTFGAGDIDRFCDRIAALECAD
ncbi:MAG: UDP-N-acetylmuramate--L-alanine ligase [Alistipes sp.]|nr:UDP-N-acetylmuramate--L-alanine ligase [Alistipes sp.]